MSAPPLVIAVVGSTATGKSRLAVELAKRVGGEVVACDSTAVYRRVDIGTDKVPAEEQDGIAHHMVDLVEPTDTYTAARYARDAAAVVRDVQARGHVPIVTGGSGLYYRALTRGLFPGPARDAALRARLERIAHRAGVERLHRALAVRDPASGLRIQPRDLKRIVRALEVLVLTGRPLTDHFTETRSPIEGMRVEALALRLPDDLIADRVARRVDAQFARGVVDEVRGLLAAGVPPTAHALSGLVYRQIREMLQGVRDETGTRALIARENRHYARRQLIWFRKEPNLHWLDTPGEEQETVDRAAAWLVERGVVA